MVSNFIANPRYVRPMNPDGGVGEFLPHCIKFSDEVLSMEPQGSSKMLHNIDAVTLYDDFLNLTARSVLKRFIKSCLGNMYFNKHGIRGEESNPTLGPLA